MKLRARGLIVAVSMLLGTSVWAGDKEKEQSAASALERGKKLLAAGDDTGALTAFRESYELSPSGEATAQIGIAQLALRRWVEAEEQLLEALSLKDDVWIRRSRAALENALARVQDHLGSLEVVGRPTGAEIKANGEFVSVLPTKRKVRLVVGATRVRVAAPGFRPYEEEVMIVPRGTVLVEANLAPTVSIQPPPPKIETAVSTTPTSTPAREASAPIPPDQGAQGLRTIRTVSWILMIGGAVSLAASVPILFKERGALGGGLAGGGAGGLVMGGALLLAVSLDQKASTHVAISRTGAVAYWRF